MEFGAVGDHPGLRWLGCLDAVGGSGGGWLGGSRASDHADADLHFGPHAATVVEDSGVPFDKVFEGDLLVADDLAARHAFGDPVESGTVGNHSWLGWLWSLNTVAGACGRAGDG